MLTSIFFWLKAYLLFSQICGCLFCIIAPEIFESTEERQRQID